MDIQTLYYGISILNMICTVFTAIFLTGCKVGYRLAKYKYKRK